MDERIHPENEWQAEPVPVKPVRDYSAAECVFAWLCLLAGYWFCRAFPVWTNPLGGFVVILLLFISSTVVLLRRGSKPGWGVVPAALSAVAIATSLILITNGFLRFLAFTYAIIIYCYYVYAATGNSLKKGFSDFIAVDFLKALFVMPFCSFAHMFKAMFTGKAKRSGKMLIKVLAGVALAVVPTLIVSALLSYDKGFSDLLEKILNLDGFDLLSHLFSFLFGIPVGMYLYGLYISSADGKCSGAMTAEKCQSAAEQMKFVPAITAVTAVMPLIFLYVVFFLSQWSYYMSGFTGVLPQSFSYAEYAREGFFQLCTVSVINLLVLTAVIAFMRRGSRATRVLFKAIAITLSLFTLILIATAIAKLVMYIGSYGLTPKRVYAAWFMGLLAVIFLLIIVKQFAGKLPVVAASIVAFAVLFAGLTLPNTDGFIAKYNVDRYLAGSLETVDVDAMEDLGLAAVPQMVRLMDVLEEQEVKGPLYLDTTQCLHHIHRAYLREDASLFAWSIPYQQAKNAIEGLDMDTWIKVYCGI
ncbi:MAG: DUF4173 domain-containing protein [Ruminococcaceae bacterium]|nr:DUF4173 domain-containing protein [Oscillospiraceae bacterium]